MDPNSCGSSETSLCCSHFTPGSNWQRRLRLQEDQIPLSYVSVGAPAGQRKDFACWPPFQRPLVPDQKAAPPCQTRRLAKDPEPANRPFSWEDWRFVSAGNLCRALGLIVSLSDCTRNCNHPHSGLQSRVIIKSNLVLLAHSQ